DTTGVGHLDGRRRPSKTSNLPWVTSNGVIGTAEVLLRRPTLSTTMPRRWASAVGCGGDAGGLVFPASAGRNFSATKRPRRRYSGQLLSAGPKGFERLTPIDASAVRARGRRSATTRASTGHRELHAANSCALRCSCKVNREACTYQDLPCARVTSELDPL